jgi:hypothetical protein
MKMKRIKMMLVAMVAILALGLGAGSAHAQTGLSDNIYTLPAGNFVGQAEADALLADQISSLKSILGTLTPGTQAYQTMEQSVNFYAVVQGEVISGKDIPSSIVTGLQFISQDANGSVATKTQLLTLRTDSVNLLSL